MDAETLRRELFAAIAARDGKRFHALCMEQADRVFESFHSWLVVPASIRTSPNEVKFWVDSLILIARFFASAGHPELLESIGGNNDDNPIDRWRDGLQHAQQLSSQGSVAASNEILLALAAEMKGATGSAIDNLFPIIHGTLGMNFGEAGDYMRALEYTGMALRDCQRTGDQAGIRIYVENLQVLWAAHLPAVDPNAGQRVHKCRETIIKAQKLSDAAKYTQSNAVLLQLLLTMNDLAETHLTGYLGKVAGHLGWNYFYLRDVAEAVKWTERAVQACSRAGDVAGVRIYEENLQTIRTPRPRAGSSSLD